MLYTDVVNQFRKDIKQIAAEVKTFKDGDGVGASDVQVWAGNSSDIGEVRANFALAYRHLEDASMRIGKAIQAKDGGVSVYDKETTVGT